MKKGKFNNFYYEQMLLEELPRTGDEADINNKQFLDQLKLSNKEILDKYPPGLMAESIRKKVNSGSTIINGSFKKNRIYIPLTAAAVFLLFFSLFPVFQQKDRNDIIDQTETIRLKGNTPSLFIYRGNKGDAELLANNSIVKERDLLQISYDGAGIKYGLIFSIDGRGSLTLHFPDNVYSSTRLDFGGKVSLPYSYELDNAPFFERFFFITSDNEIPIHEIMEDAGRIAQGNKSEMLNLTDEIKQQSIILFKEEAE